jgi:hypothetical protein
VRLCCFVKSDTLVSALLVGRSRDRPPVVSLGIFFRGSFRQNHVPWGRLSLWKWVPGISPGVKAAGAFGWRPATLVVLKVEKIRGLNLPGTPRATSICRGTHYFTFWYTNTTKATNLLLSFQKSLLSWSSYLVKLQFLCPIRSMVHKNWIEMKSVECNIARIYRWNLDLRIFFV